MRIIENSTNSETDLQPKEQKNIQQAGFGLSPVPVASYQLSVRLQSALLAMLYVVSRALPRLLS